MTGRQRLVFLAIAAVIVVVAVVVLAGGDDDDNKKKTTTTSTPTQIVVSGGKVEGGTALIEASQGDTARFSVTSDVADEVHVHGYDVKKDVTAGGTVQFAIKATITGDFEIELEDAKLKLAELRVEP